LGGLISVWVNKRKRKRKMWIRLDGFLRNEKRKEKKRFLFEVLGRLVQHQSEAKVELGCKDSQKGVKR
jgi:hypothetical protein